MRTLKVLTLIAQFYAITSKVRVYRWSGRTSWSKATAVPHRVALLTAAITKRWHCAVVGVHTV